MTERHPVQHDPPCNVHTSNSPTGELTKRVLCPRGTWALPHVKSSPRKPKLILTNSQKWLVDVQQVYQNATCKTTQALAQLRSKIAQVQWWMVLQNSKLNRVNIVHLVWPNLQKRKRVDTYFIEAQKVSHSEAKFSRQTEVEKHNENHNRSSKASLT